MTWAGSHAVVVAVGSFSRTGVTPDHFVVFQLQRPFVYNGWASGLQLSNYVVFKGV